MGYILEEVLDLNLYQIAKAFEAVFWELWQMVLSILIDEKFWLQ